jgi:PAS domain S-box-containing protein
MVFRAWRGGSGAWAGIAALAVVAGLGVAVHWWTRRAGGIRWRHSAALGAAVFLVTLCSFAVLGRREFAKFAHVWTVYFAVYGIGIALVARLFHDVGERARLAVDRARFRAIIDEATDAIRIVDPQTMRIVDANLADCRLAGYDRSEMIGRDIRDFWPTDPALRTEHERLEAEAYTRGTAERRGLTCRTGRGPMVRLDVVRRRVAHGGRAYDLVLARDAAPREAAEAAAREAQELRAATLVASTAAHEINNPLAIVIGSLDLLLRQVPTTGRERQLVDRAVSAGERIRDIVTRMTKIRRIAEGKQTPSLPSMLDLQRSTEAATDDSSGEAQWKPSSTPSSS